jgi:hypothetical protein
MARALGLAVAFLLLLAPGASAVFDPSGELIAGSEETVLRLHDLPPGYQVGDDSGCYPLSPIGGEGGIAQRLQRRYLKWIVDTEPEGCGFQYEQLFKVPGLGPAPPRVFAQTINTPSEAAAARGFKIYSALFNLSKEGRDRKIVAIPPSGTRAFLVHGRDRPPPRDESSFVSVLFWRHGRLFGALQVSGASRRGNDRAILRFAQIQQGRMERPSLYTEAEQNDTEVRLDNPELKFPIYWLGSSFQHGGGPTTELEDAEAGTPGLPGVKLALEYIDAEDNQIQVSGWTRRSWRQFQRSALGKVNQPARCTRTTEIELEQGNAVIYGAYDGKRLQPCPKRAPDRYYAIARIGQMVIGVDLGLCLSCAPGSSGPYGSAEGMEAILRALTVRPKPVY